MTVDKKQLSDKIFKTMDHAETVLYILQGNSDKNEAVLPVGVVRGMTELMEKIVANLCDLSEMEVTATCELIKAEPATA